MLVYKYVRPQRIDILIAGRIRFTQVDGLNDPFETNPCFDDYRQSIENDLQKRMGVEIDEIPSISEHCCARYRDKIRQSFLVLSLTKERNNLVMWSHYTDAHRGFVIGLDSENAFFSEFIDGKKNTTPLKDVIYVDERVRVPTINRLQSLGEVTSSEYMSYFRTKSTHWEYEKELRMFAQPFYDNICGKDCEGLDMYFHELRPDCIREIVFGYLMSPDNKKKIIMLVESRFPHVELYEARLSETKFDLDIERLR